MSLKKNIPEFKFKGEPLSNENTQRYMSVYMVKEKQKLLNESNFRDEFIAKIFLKRIEVYELKFMVTDFFFAMCIATFVNTPGRVMILLRLCYQYWKNTGKEIIDIDDFAYIFPWGTPTESELEQMWNSQKYFDRPENCSDNLLDYPELWSSEGRELLKKSEKSMNSLKKRKINWN